MPLSLLNLQSTAISFLSNGLTTYINFRSPGIRLVNYHGGTKKEREKCLSKVQRRGGVLITSYGNIVNDADLLATKEGRDFLWVSNFMITLRAFLQYQAYNIPMVMSFLLKVLQKHVFPPSIYKVMFYEKVGA